MASRLRWVLACLVACVLPPAWGDGTVQLIASEEGGAYREAAEAFRAAFGAVHPLRSWQLAQLDGAQLRALSGEHDLIVAIGLRAARTLALHYGGQAAVLTLMLPRASAERLLWPVGVPRRKVSHVYIDQPASRTLGLVVAAFPQARRVALVVSSENAEAVKSLQQDAARRRLSLNLNTVAQADEVAPALREVLPDSDVLLLLPDSISIHAGNVQNVLLTTYRHRVPVVGFSPGLAKAGAVAAVSSSPAQIGRQGGLMALHWKPESGDLPASRDSDAFSVVFNPQVARSLGVILPDLAQVRKLLGAEED